MTSINVAARAASRTRPAFYLILSLVMAAVIIGGFSRTVPDDFTASPSLPVLLYVHGAIFSLWVVLLVIQPALIFRGSIRLHRRLGLAGARGRWGGDRRLFDAAGPGGQGLHRPGAGQPH